MKYQYFKRRLLLLTEAFDRHSYFRDQRKIGNTRIVSVFASSVINGVFLATESETVMLCRFPLLQDSNSSTVSEANIETLCF